MSVGKVILGLGVLLVLVGLLVMLAERAHLPLGRLPGDISYRSKNVSFYFPLATCVLISLVLSLIMWLVNRK